MGRKKKYLSSDERKAAQLKWAREHYERNRNSICRKNRERYHKNKRDLGDKLD